MFHLITAMELELCHIFFSIWEEYPRGFPK